MRLTGVSATIAAVFLACSHAAVCQSRWADFAEPVFRSLGPQQGLPSPAVTAIAEDGDGFLWAGTEGGLARWDGYHFRAYKPQSGVLGALQDAWITTLHTDARGTLWIGTSAGGLARHDRDHDSFTTLVDENTDLGGVKIASIVDDGADGLWVGTLAGLNHLDAANGAAKLRHVDRPSVGLPDDRINAMLRDRSGTLWVGTMRGLVRRPVGVERFAAVPLGSPPLDTPAIASLFEGPDGRIWIGTMKHGAFVAGEQDAHAIRAAAQPHLNPAHLDQPHLDQPHLDQPHLDPDLAGDWVYSIGLGEAGDIWLGTYGHGIVAIDAATGHARRIRHDPMVPGSLPNDTAFAIYDDRAGSPWVGSLGGLSRLQSLNGAVTTVFGGAGQGASQGAGLSDTDVVSVLPVSNGRVWLGLASKGIDILDPVLGRVATLPPNLAAAEPMPATPIIDALAEWPGIGVFIGTFHGLYRADIDGRHVARVNIPGRDPSARTVTLARVAGRLWVGGPDDGLWSIVPGDPAAPIAHFGAGKLTDLRLTAVAAGNHGDLWIGTRNGLNRLDLASGTVEHMLPRAGDAHSLAARYVSSLLLDRRGRLWLGTFGQGLRILNPGAAGRPVFQALGMPQGLPDTNVDSILEDSSGRIWVSTDSGVAVIDPDSLAVRAVQPADGLAMTAYWSRSAAATPQGELLFGGTGGGLTVIRPDRYREWDYRPPIVVDDIRVGGAKLPDGPFNVAGLPALLTVPFEANSLAVEFSALDFAAPDSNLYSYKLEGFDRGWHATDATRRVAAYTNLPPGAYTLRLRGTNHVGRWTEAARSLPIRVLPAWYQTWLFYGAMALLAAACVTGIVQRRTHYLRRRQRELEALVAERTAELEASKREIEMIAYHDVLTGLPNRRMFNEEMTRMFAAAERHDRQFALLLIDFDRFKHINDTLGHDAGDALLVEAARRLRLMLRASDCIARLGGDEFAIIIPDSPGVSLVGREAVDLICLRIVESFIDTVNFKGTAIKTSASIGAALCPTHGCCHETLYKAADLALYDAKRSGRNTWRWHEPVAVFP